jgi:diguanylate cyclase (GGDEF)-like protein
MRMSYHDDLTGLYNRRKFNDEIQNNYFRYAIMMDIDNFHEVNNEHGHQFGDLVLKKLADICMFCGNDEFKTYRYGGEEFLILSRLDTAKTIDKIKAIMNLFYKEFGITISVGVARNNDLDDPRQVVKKADENMFFVKSHGKNNISFNGSSLVNILR